MCHALLASALAAALVTGFSARASPPPLPGRRAGPDLEIRARAAVPVSSLSAPASPGSGGAASPPPCLGDVCQPRVSVPGFDPKFSRPSRTELAAVYLERARLEPFATMAWLLLATGLRFDYNPPAFDGPSQAPTSWGSVFVRVKFRIDADNVPVIPARSRGDQRPARRSST